MSDSLGWLAAGFGAAWVLIGAYVVRLAVAQRRLADRLANIEGGGGAIAPAPVRERT